MRIDPLEIDTSSRATNSVSLVPVREVFKKSTGPTGLEGEGFPVRRTMAGISYKLTDPFIMMDEMGAITYQAGEPRGTDWHPHRGFETVTYLMHGKFLHQDSHGGGGLITPGSVQWMTAGAGILHIETPPEDLVISGGLFHGVQIWVNLPAAQKFSEPAYQGLAGEQLTTLTDKSGQTLFKVVAGQVFDRQGPAQTKTPITLVHAIFLDNNEVRLPWPATQNSLIYVFDGEVRVGAAKTPLGKGEFAVLQGPEPDRLQGELLLQGTAKTEVLLLGGRPLAEPTVQYGPFVMNTKAELLQALEDFQNGRFGQLPPNAIQPVRA